MILCLGSLEVDQEPPGLLLDCLSEAKDQSVDRGSMRLLLHGQQGLAKAHTELPLHTLPRCLATLLYY